MITLRDMQRISAAVTRTAAAHSATPGGRSPEGCCSWKENEGRRGREGEGGREGGGGMGSLREGEEDGEGGRMAALSRRIPAASRSGDFKSRLLNAAEVMQRLFPAAPSLC